MAVQLEGLDAFLQGLKDVEERYRKAAAAAVYQEATIVGRESVKQCPVDTGRLRSSFYLKPPEDLNNPVVRMGYGTDYGVYVHERVDVYHAAPTKAKFLEDPINAAKSGWAERVARRMKALVDGGRVPAMPAVSGEEESGG